MIFAQENVGGLPPEWKACLSSRQKGGARMEEIIRIPAELRIVVCDARKALILKNTGPTAQPYLVTDDHIEADAPSSDRMDSDSPGRRFDGGAAAATGGARSAMEVRDIARTEAEAFARSLAEQLLRKHRNGQLEAMMLVAPPSFLGRLRQELAPELSAILTGEVAKHLTELPLAEIQATLFKG
jgi:protein required for attachment to host cells